MPPHVHLNCAVTFDGCLGGPGRTPLRISNEADLRRVHALRAGVDAILVGVGTVLSDDPKLTVKWGLAARTGRDPLRVVLDPRVRTPPGAHVLSPDAPTLILAAPEAPDRPGWPMDRVDAGPRGLDLGRALERLDARGVRRLLVEGGARVLTSFLREDRADAATIFVSPRVLGAPDAPRLVEGPFDLSTHLRLVGAEPLGDGVVWTWTRR